MRSAVCRWVAMVILVCMGVTGYPVAAQDPPRDTRVPKLTLCPLQRAEKNMGEYGIAGVESSDAAVVSATRENRHRSVPGALYGGVYEDFLVVVAGENDTDRVKRATITLHTETYYMNGRDNPGYEVLYRIPVDVLPRRRCETSEGLGTARLAGTPMDPEFNYEGHDRTFRTRLCVGQSTSFPLNKWNDDNVLLASSNNQSVATVAVDTRTRQVNGRNYEDFNITVTGVAEGTARITVNRENFRVLRPPNPDEEQDSFTRWQNSAATVHVDVIVRPCENQGEKKVGMLRSPGYKVEEAYALASHVFTFPQGNIVVNVPTDARPGETCTGSVIRQPVGNTPEEKQANAAILSEAPIQVSSVAVFADEPVKNFTVALPDAKPGMQVVTEVSISDEKTQKPLAGGVWQLATALVGQQPMAKDAAKFSCPGERETFKPLEVKGPFDGKGDTTKVSLGGEPVTVLAETPRSAIVIPQKETLGEQQLVVEENGQKFEQVIRSYPTGQLPQRPVVMQPQPSGDPVQQAIAQMCNMTIETYKSNIQAMVDEGWQAPKPPRKGTWTAILEYEITPQGMLQNVRVTQSSGFAPIDASAQARVHSMQGTFRRPPSCATQPIPITHTFKVIYH